MVSVVPRPRPRNGECSHSGKRIFHLWRRQASDVSPGPPSALATFVEDSANIFLDPMGVAKNARKAPKSPEQIAEENRRKSFELSRQRILQQLQVACNPRHRQMLEKALADLDARLGYGQ